VKKSGIQSFVEINNKSVKSVSQRTIGCMVVTVKLPIVSAHFKQFSETEILK